MNTQATERLTIGVGELGQKTGLSRWTIYNLVAERRIPHLKVGRRVLFPVKELERWMSENTVRPVH